MRNPALKEAKIAFQRKELEAYDALWDMIDVLQAENIDLREELRKEKMKSKKEEL